MFELAIADAHTQGLAVQLESGARRSRYGVAHLRWATPPTARAMAKKSHNGIASGATP